MQDFLHGVNHQRMDSAIGNHNAIYIVHSTSFTEIELIAPSVRDHSTSLLHYNGGRRDIPDVFHISLFRKSQEDASITTGNTSIFGHTVHADGRGRQAQFGGNARAERMARMATFDRFAHDGPERVDDVGDEHACAGDGCQRVGLHAGEVSFRGHVAAGTADGMKYRAGGSGADKHAGNREGGATQDAQDNASGHEETQRNAVLTGRYEAARSVNGVEDPRAGWLVDRMGARVDGFVNGLFGKGGGFYDGGT